MTTPGAHSDPDQPSRTGEPADGRSNIAEPVDLAKALNPAPSQPATEATMAMRSDLSQPGPAIEPNQPAMPAHPVPPAQLRASTADRESVARVLQTAMAEGRITMDELSDRLETVYQAKTLGELEPVTRDLPEHRPLVPSVNPNPYSPVSAAEVGYPAIPLGVMTSSSAIAVMGGAERKGVWAVPATFTAVAIMGGIEIDLTEAIFTSGEVTINAWTMWGGIEIKVPDDVIVREDGIGFMGAFESSAPPPTGLPRAIVRVRGLALMGGVDVRPLSAKERKRRLKGDRKRLN